jgi:hypothetical protein
MVADCPLFRAGLPRNAGVELDDSDFAHINTGLSTRMVAFADQTDRSPLNLQAA